MEELVKPVIFAFNGKAFEVYFDDDSKGYLRDGRDWSPALKYIKTHIPEKDHADFLNMLAYVKREFAI